MKGGVQWLDDTNLDPSFNEFPIVESHSAERRVAQIDSVKNVDRAQAIARNTPADRAGGTVVRTRPVARQDLPCRTNPTLLLPLDTARATAAHQSFNF